MDILKTVNLALRFLLELCLLFALGYWGFTSMQGWPLRVVVGIGAPLLIAVIWGIFIAPKATMRLDEPWRLILELVICGLAVAALVSVDRSGWAWTLGGLFILNRLLLSLWRQ